MYRYTFSDGHTVTSTLTQQELLKRMRRLDILSVLVEGHDQGYGLSIYRKACNAYNRTDNFTGIIRLTPSEKDWLGYLLETDMLTQEDISVINYYLRH